MKIPITLGALTLGTAAVFVGQMNSDAIAARGGGGGNNGPNVIVGSIDTPANYSTVGSIKAYAIGTTSCNIGNDYLEWQSNNNNHPTIGGCMYRMVEYSNGSSRIEHIGRSWLKHGFCALQYNLCGACTNPGGSGCADRLGWNCSDPYTASLNGQQSNLGPRDEVNPTTGWFQYPPGGGSYPATIGRRLQVNTSYLAEHANPDVRYFVDGIYIHPDDAAACNGNDNASWHEVNVSSSGNISLIGSTVRTQPAIFAWEADPNVRVTTVDMGPCQERFHYAVSVGDNNDGTWTYHYAIYNLNMDNAIGGVVIPHDGATPTNVEQVLAPYHSGDWGFDGGNDFDDVPWTELSDGSTLSFATESFSVNPDAHALRWQSMATFSFTSTLEPVEGDIEVNLFKTSEAVLLPTTIPGGKVQPPSDCELADVSGDDSVDGTDLSIILGFWGANNYPPADINEDGDVNGVDLSFVLGWWGCTPE